MKGWYFMKKKGCGRALTMFLVTALAASTVLAGCGKKKVDYNMGDDENGSSGGGKLVSRLDVPDSYQGAVEDIDSETGLKEVKIDVSKIVVPDTDKMSVLYYQQNTIDNEYKKRVCESFFDVSAGVYAYSWEKPYKGDIEREIENYQTLADQATSDDDKSFFDDYIKSLKEQLKTASDEREGAGDYSADAFVGSKGENMYMISFNSTETGASSGFSIDYYPSDQLINYKPKEGASTLYCYSSDYYDGENSANTATMTQDAAIQKGIDFLASCGISDIIETQCKDLIWEYSDSSYNTVATEKDGYVITYKRSVDGIAPYTPYVYNIDSLSSDDTWYDTMDETFEINIDDNGIVSGYCYDYFKATGDKDENVDLISWEDALKALPKAVNTYYSANKTQYSSIEFNDVELAYYKIKDGDKYKYTPVWVFAQCEKAEDGDSSANESGLNTSYPSQIIMLDAVTGELIDLKSVLSSQTYSIDDSTISDQMIIGGDSVDLGDGSDSVDLGDGSDSVDDSDSSDSADGTADIDDLEATTAEE